MFFKNINKSQNCFWLFYFKRTPSFNQEAFYPFPAIGFEVFLNSPKSLGFVFLPSRDEFRGPNIGPGLFGPPPGDH